MKPRFAAVLFAVGCVEPDSGGGGGSLGGLDSVANVLPRNVVVILTDDQRWDTMWAMPITSSTIMEPGVWFPNAYVPTPMCCPSRASFLSGGYYAQHTQVLGNDALNGGVSGFKDESTLPVELQRAGWRTGLVGKYLNGYGEVSADIPPGWDDFESPMNDGWTSYTWFAGSSTPDSAGVATVTAETEYLTDFELTRARAFLAADDGRPFFFLFSVPAPHEPATPAPGDESLFLDYAYSVPSVGEDVSDKPAWVRNTTPPDPAVMAETIHSQLQSLQAVDRAVGVLMADLEASGRLADTLVVFASDNGNHWGEHGLVQKGTPYDESIRVPMAVRSPGLVPGEFAGMTYANLDVASTIAALADLPHVGEGRSLLPLLRGGAPEERESILFEFAGEEPAPPFSEIVTADWKYVVYANGERELYDRRNDPYELENLAKAPPADAPIEALLAEVEDFAGLTLRGDTASAVVGAPLDWGPTASGGRPPYAWSFSGTVPEGLTFDTTTGHFVGTPTAAGSTRGVVVATDSSASPWNGAPERFAASISLVVTPAPGPAPRVRVLDATSDGAHLRIRADAGAGAWLSLRTSPDPDFDHLATESEPVFRRGVTELIVDVHSRRVNYWQLRVGGQALGPVRAVRTR